MRINLLTYQVPVDRNRRRRSIQLTLFNTLCNYRNTLTVIYCPPPSLLFIAGNAHLRVFLLIHFIRRIIRQ